MFSFTRVPQMGSSPICGHDDLDVSPGVESIELIDEFQHRSLHFIVSSCSVVESGTTNRVDFIEEDNASFLRSGHFKQFSDHSGTFTNVLLDQLGSDDY
jgi:hypothetical protein